MNKIIKKIKNQLKKNKIILYMKGTPNIPYCGFSTKTVEILKKYKIRFAYVNILENSNIKLELIKLSKWPTFPQLWVNEKLIGGYDIILEMHKNNELKNIFKINNN